MIPKTIKEILAVPIPNEVIKERSNGKDTLSYISGSTVIDILNRAFDYNWDFEVLQAWKEESCPKFNPYSKLPDSQKVDYNGKRGAWEPQSPVVHAKVLLTVRYINDAGIEKSIKKTGFGSKVLVGGASEQESAFKAAGTDALKKAASLLGIGAQLYRSQEEEAFFEALHYEDPWTEEMRSKYEKELEYIMNFQNIAGISEEAFAQLCQQYDEYFVDYDYLLPDNVESIYSYLKEQITATTKKTSMKEAE